MILFALFAKSVAVYIADIYTTITLLAFHHFNGSIYTRVENDPTNNLRVPFVYGKWIFTGCIIFSFCLLAYEANKTRRIVRSRDISYAYTCVAASCDGGDHSFLTCTDASVPLFLARRPQQCHGQ